MSVNKRVPVGGAFKGLQGRVVDRLSAQQQDLEESLNNETTGLTGRVGTLENFTTNYVWLRDEKADGTNGGDFTNGAWRTRTLTESADPNNLCTLASNQFVLVAGTYRIYARCPAYAVTNHQAILRNITASTTIILGSTAYAANATFVQTDSIIMGVFTIAANQTLEIQHRCNTTVAGTGMGRAGSFGVGEIYTDVMLWKIA